MQIPQVRFSERMTGFVTLGEADCESGFRRGRARGSRLDFELEISVADASAFIADDNHEAPARGHLDCELLGGRREVKKARVRLLAPSERDPKMRLMAYRLEFDDGGGCPRTLIGVKHVKDNPGHDLWWDTTTLWIHVVEGHDVDWHRPLREVEAGRMPRLGRPVIAAGKVSIGLAGFLRLLGSLLGHGLGSASGFGASLRWGRFFLRELWRIYAPQKLASLRRRRLAKPGPRPYPLSTVEGVPGARVSTHFFATEDGLNLSLTRFQSSASNGSDASGDAVLLIHGLTSSSDMFIMPEHRNLVRYLHAEGFADVWCLDYRMSCRFPYNLRRHRFTMDDVALYDHPAAVKRIRELIGSGRRLHVICHCVGSMTFMMSLFGRQVEGITSVISNSVSLSPRLALWSRIKLAIAPSLVEYGLQLPYVDPSASEDPGITIGKLFSKAVSLLHRECDVPACHMLSMMWGTGCPALFCHENIDERTHRRLRDLFGGTGVHYYRHVRAMLRHGNTAVKLERGNSKYDGLPDNYFQHAKNVDTPVLFVTGDQNNVFQDSNPLTFERLEKQAPGRHRLLVFPSYGHQDVFMGKKAAEDVFPALVRFMREHSIGKEAQVGTEPPERREPESLPHDEQRVAAA
jgi:cholesterol oxidase